MMMCCMLGLALGVYAQESVFLQQYREKVKAYKGYKVGRICRFHPSGG